MLHYFLHVSCLAQIALFTASLSAPHFFRIFTSLQTLLLPALFVLISILCFPHFNTSNAFHASNKLNKFFFFLPPVFIPSSLISPSSHFPLYLTSDDLSFLFAAHTVRHCGKNKEVNGGMDRRAGKRGKGALWENTHFAVFPKPTIFPGGWENRRGVGRGWERKRDNPCHPPNPKAAMRLCFMYPFCKHIFPFHSIK